MNAPATPPVVPVDLADPATTDAPHVDRLPMILKAFPSWNTEKPSGSWVDCGPVMQPRGRTPRVYLGPGDGRDRMNDRDTALA
jgi:hypothetical protein